MPHPEVVSSPTRREGLLLYLSALREASEEMKWFLLNFADASLIQSH